jgi:hypothetical protein
VTGTVLVVIASVAGRGSAAPLASAGGPAAAPGRHAQLVGSVNMARLAALPSTGAPQAKSYKVLPEHDRHGAVAQLLSPKLTLGGATAPPARLVESTPTTVAAGIKGMNITEMEGGGTGKWAGTNGGLEPPDQALCVGNGYVLEGVNTAWKVWKNDGTPLTAPVPLTQFFNIAPAGQPGGSSFTSDPRCIYDARSGRFFALTLEADEASGITQIPFVRSHTYFAVSKTGDPTGDWWIYNIDITDDGLQGTPLHPSCPCIDDQPLMGLDSHGLYLSANQYSNSEIVPVPLPGPVGGGLNQVFSTLPDYRNGPAQVYALSKAALLSGTTPAVISFDTATIPVPAEDQGQPGGIVPVWSSLQPAFSPPGDSSAEPSGGAEFFMSQLDFYYKGDHRIAVWALTNTSSLETSSPSLQLKHKVIETLDPSHTYTAPVFGVDQKDGPHPLGDTCGCALEQINANDDRMNQLMLTNGTLWSGVNTALPAIDPAGTGRDTDLRAGIMYFQVKPGIDSGGEVSATMLRDGYINVPRSSVIFPSIAASPAGPVGAFFSLSGLDQFPSTAWARLDGLGPNDAPVVHISAKGTAPEDGFTGYPLSNQLGFLTPAPVDPSNGATGVARWGDYSAAAVDESGCLWGRVGVHSRRTARRQRGQLGNLRDPRHPSGLHRSRVRPAGGAAQGRCLQAGVHRSRG